MQKSMRSLSDDLNSVKSKHFASESQCKELLEEVCNLKDSKIGKFKIMEDLERSVY